MVADEVALETHKLADFLQLVEDWRERYDVGERAVYRGHTDFNWVLMAKLFRNPDAKPENSQGDTPEQVEKQLLGEHLEMTEAHDIERSNARSMQEWRQLAIAQHYGLPTRFLDFTTNAFVALYLAVEEPPAYRKTTSGEWREQDSAVWCVEAPNRLKVWEVWEKDDVWLSPLEFADEGSDPPIGQFVDTAYVPEHIDDRIRVQGSVFMCEPRGKKRDWQLHVKLRDKTEATLNRQTNKSKKTRTRRIRIPKDARERLRDQLDLVGVNRATLFPDLGSAARHLAWAVHQRKRPYGR
jgi:hypothetical protein